MNDAFFHLDRVLRSKKVAISSREANILESCKVQAVRDFWIGTAGSATVTWLATRRLIDTHRITLTGIASGLFGLWWFAKSIDSSVDHILSMEGTRIRNELAKSVLMKYKDNPSVMQRISKHFVSEHVYDDFSSDRPKLMWRVRNSFMDYTPERTEMHDDEHFNEISSKKTTDEKTNLLQDQGYLRTAISGMEDPFDSVFGLPPTMKETHQADATNTPPGRNGRSQKRSHRRHRKQVAS